MFVGPWNFKGKHPYGILFNLQKEKSSPANQYIYRPNDVITSYIFFFVNLQLRTVGFVHFKKGKKTVTK